MTSFMYSDLHNPVVSICTSFVIALELHLARCEVIESISARLLKACKHLDPINLPWKIPLTYESLSVWHCMVMVQKMVDIKKGRTWKTGKRKRVICLTHLYYRRGVQLSRSLSTFWYTQRDKVASSPLPVRWNMLSCWCCKEMSYRLTVHLILSSGSSHFLIAVY